METWSLSSSSLDKSSISFSRSFAIWAAVMKSTNSFTGASSPNIQQWISIKKHPYIVITKIWPTNGIKYKMLSVHSLVICGKKSHTFTLVEWEQCRVPKMWERKWTSLERTMKTSEIFYIPSLSNAKSTSFSEKFIISKDAFLST